MERWRLSGIILAEARFQGYLNANPMYRTSIKEKPEKILKTIKSNVQMNSFLLVLVLLFVALSTAWSGLEPQLSGALILRLTFSFATFLLFSFAIIYFLNLLSTIGLFSSDLYTLPAIQPLTNKESTELVMLSFIRMFFWPVVIMVTVYPFVILLFIGPIAAFIALIGCASTTMLSMGAIIVTSRWFYQKAHSSNQSRSSSVLRIVAGLGIALVMVLAYGMISFLPGIITFLSQALSSPGMEYLMPLLGAVYPVSYGILVSVALYPLAFPSIVVFISLVASLFYTGIAYLAYRRSGSILKTAIIGGIESTSGGQKKKIGIRVRGKIQASILKDLRLASRSLGTTIIFVFPVLMLIALIPMLRYMPNHYLRSFEVLGALAYVQAFSGIIVLSLLTFDTQGASILEGLPLGSTKVMQAKTVLYLFIYLISTILVAVLIALSNPITPLLIWLPLLQFPAGYAVASLTIICVYRVRGNGRAVAISLAGDLGLVIFGSIVAGVIGIIPLVCYGFFLLQYGIHLLALIGQGLASLLLCILSLIVGPHLLRN